MRGVGVHDRARLRAEARRERGRHLVHRSHGRGDVVGDQVREPLPAPDDEHRERVLGRVGHRAHRHRAQQRHPVDERAERRAPGVAQRFVHRDHRGHEPVVLGPRDQVAPAADSGAEVAHDEHRLAGLVAPAVDDRVADAGRERVEDTVAPQQELPPDGVAGEPHREVEVRVHPLDHEPAAVAEPHPLDRRAGTSVVSADRHPFDGFVEDRGHRAALAPWKSALCSRAGTRFAPGGEDSRQIGGTGSFHLVSVRTPRCEPITPIVAGSTKKRAPARGPSSSATAVRTRRRWLWANSSTGPSDVGDPVEHPLPPGRRPASAVSPPGTAPVKIVHPGSCSRICVGREALVLAVVPLDEVVVDRRVGEPGQPRGLARPGPRAA